MKAGGGRGSSAAPDVAGAAAAVVAVAVVAAAALAAVAAADAAHSFLFIHAGRSLHRCNLRRCRRQKEANAGCYDSTTDNKSSEFAMRGN